ncbi:methyltransferase domain-containing protein [Pseudoalteromonas peptidolytica]|uniref:Malonyl-CoA O-methyltransferase n=1 Tax=Pseudoalteromonas peptidolytica F12-50-A1 TaxID=1315280 RepID=A0A8I0T4N2_9GAMM|nr:methyltransferase domain-containing protein [Pseudoalteromonas peptidolytica]MBE0346383.1 malonyl-CoA O-methyltransferase [Pseudoalteromonas peptidolytica F12-50-A1]NLR14672.1 methyltransferase domain-containing protein [Pseudoalteromonas peptidolytica]GEK08983.1 malonyl-[acyl-carrier protein] O-methyltransferase [Pseudoalteromonas peptidolytica]
MSKAEVTQTAKCFSKAAKTYSQHANVQKQAANILFSRLAHYNSEQGVVRMFPRMLDLGCGPHENYHRLKGYTTQYLGADLSHAMLASQVNLSASVCCDMDKLALQASCIDLVFSNFAIQWSNSPEMLFQELYRVLKNQGRVILSSVLTGSLAEINTAWQAIDECSHVNTFHTLTKLSKFAEKAGFKVVWTQEETLIDRYDSALKALRSVKKIGANDVKAPTKRQGLLGKAAFRRLLAHYPQSGCGFDVSYQVGFLELQK